MTQGKEVFVTPDRCMGCHSCQIACGIEHSKGKSMYAILSKGEQPKPRLYIESVAPDHAVPIVCRHCADAPCVNACIAGAIFRNEEGSVVTDQNKCIGCWTCVMTCPYGVIGRHVEEQKAYRCDLCPDLATPACVSACSTGALEFESVESFNAVQRQRAAQGLLAGEEG